MMPSTCTGMATFLQRLFLKHISRNSHIVSKGRRPVAAIWTKLPRKCHGTDTATPLLRAQAICSNFMLKLHSSTIDTEPKALPNIETLVDTALQGQHPSSLSAVETYQVLQRLENEFYASLSHISWFQRNRHIGFIQLLLADKLKTFPKPIWDHPLIESLMQNVHQQCDNMSPRELSYSLLSLMYLGVMDSPYMEPIVPTLVLRCQERMPTFDLEALDVITGIRSRMFQRDWVGMQKELNRFTEVFAEEQERNDWNPQKAYHLGNTILNCLSLPLTNIEQHVKQPVKTLLTLLQDQAFLEDPDTICMYLRLARKLFMKMRENQKQARQLIRLTSDASLKHIDQFDMHNVAISCSALRQCRCFTPELMNAFRDRGLALLNDNCTLSDVSNLFYSINQHTSLDIKRRYESAIFQHLNGEVDIVILSNLAENLATVNVRNNDLMILFQEHIAKQADKLAAYTTRLNKIVRLLIRKPFIVPEHEVVFKKSVMSALEKEFKMSSLALFTLYLLPSSNTALDEAFMDRILNSIPKLQSYDHHRIALGINQMRLPMTSQLRRQVATIQAALYEQIMSKGVEEITTLDYLYQITMEIVVHNRKRDPSLTTHFMEMFPRFTKNVNDIGLIKVLHVFHDLAYYLPEVYDDLVQFAINHFGTIQSERLVYLLSTLARVGYTPKRFDEFVSLMLGVYHQLDGGDDLRNQLLLMRSLNVLQVYPEKELQQVFSIDYIERLDGLIEGHPLQKLRYEQLMMVLNRNVVLECPQLDIPWFHEQYVTDNVKLVESDKPNLSRRFRDNVEEVLIDVEVLQRANNIRRHIHTRYGYLINFECLLNEKNEPVPPKDYVNRVIPRDWQRIAVLTLTESSYTCNSRRTLGLEQLRWRHLEIMGYKVVEVPYFEWYSMGLSDYHAKVDFLSDRIFSR